MGMWTILEEGRDGYDREMGFRGTDPENEAYMEGCRHGYMKAMKEVHGDMGERRGRMGYREDYGGRGGYMDNYGERRMGEYLPEGPYMDWMSERRRRRANGQFY